jgi:chaperonin GroES
MSDQNLQPIDNRVVVKRDDLETKTASGIFIPEAAAKESSIAKVLAVGPGKMQENGIRTPMTVKVGDKVLLGKYSGTQTEVNGVEVTVLREDEILAIIV